MTESEATAPLESGTATPRNIYALTSLRGLLALWVVGYHYANDLIRLFPSLRFSEALLHSGGMAVPGFFMLSGFVIAHNYAGVFKRPRPIDALNFYGMRLARIYPVHLFTLLTVLAMLVVGQRLGYRLTDDGYSVRDFIFNLFLVHYWFPSFRLSWNFPSWSISAEWFAYLLFPFAIWAIHSRLTNRRRATIALATSITAAVAVYSTSLGALPLLTVIPTFCAGLAIHGLKCSTPSNLGRRRFLFVPELLVGTIGVACFLTPKWSTILLLSAICGLIGELAFVNERAHRFWNSQALVFFGELSFSLYMTHTLAQKVLNRVLPSHNFEGAAFAKRIAVALVYAGLVMSWCLLTYYAVERPFRIWGRRRLSLTSGANAGRSAYLVPKRQMAE